MNNTLKILASTMLSASLVGCAAPVVVGAVATASYFGLQERTAEQIAMDTKVKIHIKDRLTNTKYQYLANIGVTVFAGDVLLTGIVPNAEEGKKVLEVVKTTPDVKRIYNELFVGAESVKQQAEDTWITTQIKPRLMGNKQTFPLNYSITTVNNHVYVIGYVSSDEEHEHVLHILRTTKGVKKVHDYLRLAPGVKDPSKRKSLIPAGIKSKQPPSLPEDL